VLLTPIGRYYWLPATHLSASDGHAYAAERAADHKWGNSNSMRHERAYARRQRAVTFAGTTRSVTIPLEVADFERLEQLAAKHNVGNATLVREIVRKYRRRLNEKAPALGPGLS
jgi:predicted DNA binding CopG/RHH family protein